MRITHIYHSGFVVELDSHTLIFDWYAGALPTLNPNKDLTVFVTHAHRDHYSEHIWELEGPRTRYVLDDDLALEAEGHTSTTLVEPHTSYKVGDMVVETLESNDEGVAYLVLCEGHRIYHAGDLNVWWWDRPERENLASETFYRGELERLGGKVDVAFVVLDPRLVDPCIGAAVFEEMVGTRALVPTHYWDNGKRARELAHDVRLVPHLAHFHFEDVFYL